MPNHAGTDPRELLEHEDFVRALARRILIHDDRVDDAVQETWLQALQHGPANLSALRSWLATVVRNFGKQRLRSDSRHDARLRSLQEPPRVPTPAEILEREAMRRRVVEAVLELREPYRSAILLRFFEELESEEVAERLGIPIETARTRIKRGLAQLRERLAKRLGRRWQAALLPLLGREVHGTVTTTSTASWMGILIMSAKTKIATGLAIALLVAGGFWMAEWDGAESDVVERASEGLPEVEAAEVDDLTLATPDGRAQPVLQELPKEPVAEAEEIDAESEEPSSPTEEPAKEPNLIVTVKTLAGEPVPEAVVSIGRLVLGEELDPLERGEPTLLAAQASTDSSGKASFELAPGRFSVAVSKPGHCSWRRECRVDDRLTEVEIRLGLTAVVTGRVLDEAGLPLEGAEARLVLEARVGNSVTSVDAWCTARTDALGEFRLEDIPVQVDTEHELRIRDSRYADSPRQKLDLTGGEETDAGVIRLLERQRVLRGVVVSSGGVPVPDAEVTVKGSRGSWEGESSADLHGQTDVNGAFEIGGVIARPYKVFVSSEEHGRAVREITLEDVAGDFDLGRIVLEPPAWMARGHVVDLVGRPIESVEVGLAGRSTTTDGNGYFEVPADGAGPLSITLRWNPPREGAALVARRIPDVQLSAEPLELGLYPVGLRLDLYDGSTSERARADYLVVQWQNRQGGTNRNVYRRGGSMIRLSATQLPPGRHELEVLAEGFEKVQVEAEIPEDLDHEIVVPVYLTRR